MAAQNLSMTVAARLTPLTRVRFQLGLWTLRACAWLLADLKVDIRVGQHAANHKIEIDIEPTVRVTPC